MSINGDLPGLSKCWFGTIGSCQYSTLRALCGSTFSPGAETDAAVAIGAGVRAEARCVPAKYPAASRAAPANTHATAGTSRVVFMLILIGRRPRSLRAAVPGIRVRPRRATPAARD